MSAVLARHARWCPPLFTCTFSEDKEAWVGVEAARPIFSPSLVSTNEIIPKTSLVHIVLDSLHDSY